MAVLYALADFVTGGPILDLPIMEGADWAAQLNRPDSVGCKVDLRDSAAKKLDLLSAAEPEKTILLARTEDDVVLAWGILGEPEWDEDSQELSLSATGVLSSYFGATAIAPPSSLTAPLKINDADGFPIVNPALDTVLDGYSLGTIGKKLIEQRLAWPGAPTIFQLPADELGGHERTYLFSALKSVESAVNDLMQVENGPDFAFDLQRAPDGLSLVVTMRHGSEAEPRIGDLAGVWALGKGSPITGLKGTKSAAHMGSVGWMTGGKSAGDVLISRVRNPAILAAGYPPRDIIDTSHNDVAKQSTLDAYNAENVRYGSKPLREVSFSVRGDATPALGQYRPGDLVELDVPRDHPFFPAGMTIRIMSMSGDERGESVKIGCEILDD